MAPSVEARWVGVNQLRSIGRPRLAPIPHHVLSAELCETRWVGGEDFWRHVFTQRMTRPNIRTRVDATDREAKALVHAAEGAVPRIAMPEDDRARRRLDRDR